MKNKSKEVKVPMEFNNGLMKYEPALPIKKSGKSIKIIKKKSPWYVKLIDILTTPFNLSSF